MTIPNNLLSNDRPEFALLSPDDRQRLDPRRDWERGGVALNDPSQGLNVRDWAVWTDGATVWVAPDPELSPAVPLISGTGISEVSVAFDQSMQPSLAYVEQGTTKLWWFDTVANAMTTTTFAGCRTPMLTLDDKRDIATTNGNSDIIFAYVREGLLCWRQQRDRYNVEYQLGAVPTANSRIMGMGMSRGNRLQVKLSSPPAAVHTDLLTDTLFVVSADDVLPVATGDAQPANWRSKTFVFDEQPSFGWARVEGDYPVVVKLYGDGVLFFTSPPITSQKPFRVPARRFREWVVELEGATKVVAFAMAQDIGELL
jgi:hypothetical protein